LRSRSELNGLRLDFKFINTSTDLNCPIHNYFGKSARVSLNFNSVVWPVLSPELSLECVAIFPAKLQALDKAEKLRATEITRLPSIPTIWQKILLIFAHGNINPSDTVHKIKFRGAERIFFLGLSYTECEALSNIKLFMSNKLKETKQESLKESKEQLKKKYPKIN